MAKSAGESFSAYHVTIITLPLYVRKNFTCRENVLDNKKKITMHISHNLVQIKISKNCVIDDMHGLYNQFCSLLFGIEIK